MDIAFLRLSAHVCAPTACLCLPLSLTLTRHLRHSCVYLRLYVCICPSPRACRVLLLSGLFSVLLSHFSFLDLTYSLFRIHATRSFFLYLNFDDFDVLIISVVR